MTDNWGVITPGCFFFASFCFECKNCSPYTAMQSMHPINLRYSRCVLLQHFTPRPFHTNYTVNTYQFQLYQMQMRMQQTSRPDGTRARRWQKWNAFATRACSSNSLRIAHVCSIQIKFVIFFCCCWLLSCFRLVELGSVDDNRQPTTTWRMGKRKQ